MPPIDPKRELGSESQAHAATQLPASAGGAIEASAVIAAYRSALARYLASGGEDALLQAYELGRRALTGGRGVLDLGIAHHECLRNALADARTPQQLEETVRAAGVFLGEALSSFEMVCGAYRDARRMLNRLHEALEQQARQLAHTLHDETAQLLATLHLLLDHLARQLPTAAHAEVDRARALLDLIEEQLRHLMYELRPTVLDDFGLLPALRFLAEGAAKRAGLVVIVEGSTALPGSTEERVPPNVETALYRIAQEALTNVVKHARASRVTIRVGREPEGIECRIEDDGIGFDAAVGLPHRGLGLLGIRERLGALRGRLEIRSTASAGTTLLLWIPLER